MPGLDYEEADVILPFDACERESCTNIIIIDDQIDEPDESFFVDLERTAGLDDRITLDPTVEEIVIQDDESEC